MPETEVERPSTPLHRTVAAALVALVALAVLMVGMAEVGLRRSGSTDARHTAEGGAAALAADGVDETDGGCTLALSSTSFDRPTRAAMCIVQDESVASPQHTSVAVGVDSVEADELVVCVMIRQPTTGMLSFLYDDNVQTSMSTAPLPPTLQVQRAEEMLQGDDQSWEWCPRG